MPVYTFKCPVCGAVFEEYFTRPDPPDETECHECMSPADRVMSLTAAGHSTWGNW